MRAVFSWSAGCSHSFFAMLAFSAAETFSTYTIAPLTDTIKGGTNVPANVISAEDLKRLRRINKIMIHIIIRYWFKSAMTWPVIGVVVVISVVMCRKACQSRVLLRFQATLQTVESAINKMPDRTRKSAFMKSLENIFFFFILLFYYC
jgi:hypothetical protein